MLEKIISKEVQKESMINVHKTHCKLSSVTNIATDIPRGSTAQTTILAKIQ